MKKIAILSALGLTVAMVSLQAQMTPGRILRPIRPDPNAPAARPATPDQTNATPVAPKPLVSPLVTVLDANKNNILEADEINNAPTALKKLDLNKDGQLTIEEYLGKGESTNSPLIKVLDANHDGIIDAKEIANAPSALRMLDKNFDGRLTIGEFKPLAAPVEPTPPKTTN